MMRRILVWVCNRCTKILVFTSNFAGSTVVVGLFDSLRQFTKQVGKLVSVVGDRMDDRRGDVVRIADNVDTQVRI